MVNTRIIVFGANGMLGRYVTAYFKREPYEVLGITRQELDLFTTTIASIIIYLTELFQAGDVIINCAGMINKRQVNEMEMYKVNSLFPQVLSRVCNSKKSWLYHITTDCVYTGQNGMYYKEAPHDSMDSYGLSKSLGEPLSPVQDLYTCVIRTSIIGEEHNNRSLVEWVKSNRGQKVNGYTNHWWNGVTCLELAKQIYQLRHVHFTPGLLVLVSKYKGADSINKYDLVQEISNVYDLGLTIAPYQTPQKYDRTLYLGTATVVETDLKDQIVAMRDFGPRIGFPLSSNEIETKE